MKLGLHHEYEMTVGFGEMYSGKEAGGSIQTKPSQSLNTVYEPAFCFIAQGRKRALLGEEMFRYDPGHYLLFTVDLPLLFQIEKATQDEPYLGLRLDLDPSLVASVLVEADIKINKGDASTKAMDVHTSDANLLDAVVRLGRAARSSLTVRRHAPHFKGDWPPARAF